MNKYTKPRSGFTLVEIIVTTAAISILVLILSQFFTANIKNYQINQLKLEITDQQITAFSKLTPEIKAATSVQSCDTNQLSILYYKGTLNVPPEQITYSVDQVNKTLTRNLVEPVGTPPNVTYLGQPTTSIISTNVINGDTKPLFSYFDKSGNLMTTPCDTSAVRMVQADLYSQGTGRYSSKEAESKTRLDLRSLKDNL